MTFLTLSLKKATDNWKDIKTKRGEVIECSYVFEKNMLSVIPLASKKKHKNQFYITFEVTPS